MSGDVSIRKRLVQVVCDNGCGCAFALEGHEDFFPRESFGTEEQAGKPFILCVQGCGELSTDIVSGKASYRLRRREWIEEFCRKYTISNGHTVAVEKIEDFAYRVYPFDNPNAEERLQIRPLTDVEPGVFTAIDLFSGCGGTSLGFESAGFKVVWATDWEPNACKTFAANFEVPVDNVSIQEIGRFPKADVVIGGPPCQGFSNLGEKVPLDPRRQLWRHYLRAVEQSGARAYVMENVAPLLFSAEFDEIKRVSEEMGFEVEGQVLNAADYGVPQTRKRAIIIAMKGMKPVFPEPIHRDPEKLHREKTPLFDGVDEEIKPWVTVRDVIGDLSPEPTERDWHIGRNPTPKSMARYKAIPPGGNRFDLPADLQPECWKKKTKGGTDLMGRLWWNRPSVTIRTEFFKPEKGRYLHPEAHRPITHREAMRLQGFPDDFVFVGSKISVAKQVGNAVPPPLAYAIAKTLKEALKKGKERRRTVKHSKPGDDPEKLRRELEELIRNFKKELVKPDLRTKVLALVPTYHKLRDLGASLIPPGEAKSAYDRIIAYFKRYPGVVIDGEEIAVISGISEYARRESYLRLRSVDRRMAQGRRCQQQQHRRSYCWICSRWSGN